MTECKADIWNGGHAWEADEEREAIRCDRCGEVRTFREALDATAPALTSPVLDAVVAERDDMFGIGDPWAIAARLVDECHEYLVSIETPGAEVAADLEVADVLIFAATLAARTPRSAAAVALKAVILRGRRYSFNGTRWSKQPARWR